jgi:hypothetical protein
MLLLCCLLVLSCILITAGAFLYSFIILIRTLKNNHAHSEACLAGARVVVIRSEADHVTTASFCHAQAHLVLSIVLYFFTNVVIIASERKHLLLLFLSHAGGDPHSAATLHY